LGFFYYYYPGYPERSKAFLLRIVIISSLGKGKGKGAVILYNRDLLKKNYIHEGWRL
jgi:hypothetical protein